MKKRSWLQSLMYRFARRAILFELTNVFVYEHEARPAKRCRKDAKQTGRYRVWRLSPEEIVRFAADDRLELSSNLADRLENGSYCYGLAAGDQLICYAWFATREIEPEHNSGCDPRTGIGLKLNPDTSFVYKGYTHPDYRSRGLITRALCFALDDLAKQGVTRSVSTTDWMNSPAERVLYHTGYQRVGRITTYLLANKRLLHCSIPRVDQYGITPY